MGAGHKEVYGQTELRIGIHSIAFDCEAPQKYVEPAVPTAAVVPVANGYAADPYAYASPSAPAACYGNGCAQKDSSSVVKTLSSSIRGPSSVVTVSSFVSRYCNEGYRQGCASTEGSSKATSVIQTWSAYTSKPSNQNNSTVKPSLSPPASSIVSVSVSISSSSASCSSKTPSPSPSQAPSPNYPVIKLPNVLPTCMNTWLQISASSCTSNAAADCYCKKSQFTKTVIDRVQAWSQSDA